MITLEIYGVKNVVGIPFGYRGFSDKNLPEMPVLLVVSYFKNTPKIRFLLFSDFVFGFC